MLKLKFFSKNLSKILPYKNNLININLNNKLINKKIVFLSNKFFSETIKKNNLKNPTTENLETKPFTPETQTTNKENINFDPKIDSTNSQQENLNEKNEDKDNSNKNPENPTTDEIEELRKLLLKFHCSKISYKEYKNLANNYKEKLNDEFIVKSLFLFLEIIQR